MRYHIVGVIYKRQKVTVKCLDTQEDAWLKVSLNPDTLECNDKLIPDSLQNFVQSKQENIRMYLINLNDIANEKKVCIV
ncbi:hypothetical protein BACCIP111895_03914 [Neobacillus rhizosphaerae]|uniref:Uncharacterized protein n=1 Tax=Neobacillus rhizosphaerae TaxID=2880965 RepID=A0ABM9EVK9_9BACI|nr:hypothetical protein BACCIP111895_03914 [Neobacillus rhizosphaerae]